MNDEQVRARFERELNEWADGRIIGDPTEQTVEVVAARAREIGLNVESATANGEYVELVVSWPRLIVGTVRVS